MAMVVARHAAVFVQTADSPYRIVLQVLKQQEMQRLQKALSLRGGTVTHKVIPWVTREMKGINLVKDTANLKMVATAEMMSAMHQSRIGVQAPIGRILPMGVSRKVTGHSISIMSHHKDMQDTENVKHVMHNTLRLNLHTM